MTQNRMGLHAKLRDAKRAEKDGKFEEAIQCYRSALKQDPLNIQAYSRLMVIFRKQKDYRSELKIINRAIENYQYVQTHHPGNRDPSSLKSATKELAQKLGLLDEKGAPVFQADHLSKWIKRAGTVQKKMS
ncbi:tetratricopeptide repeat protein [Sphingobacterium allocomposti]|nr:tetratricopeptide repeat protein [Sphingobacterium composti Yoo et al. 2007 non Ten et al. 2007]